ncbi:MAG: PKD domain-containing protein, partial [Thermoplasmata archaeon]
VLMAAAAEGITVLAASGDCGASDGTSGLSTDYPASDPYVTGVGGTVLTVDPNTGAWVSETGWSGNSSGASGVGCVNQGGSGGGYAPFVRPAWQTGTGISSTEKFRGVPDVALNAGTSVAITFYGNPSAVAGTSAATPAWAGIVAVGDQYAGRSLGYLNPGLYQILRGGTYAADFHDITQGSNGYSAGIGWDPVTGLGTPIAGALLPELARGTVVPSNLSVAIRANASVGPAPLLVNFTAIGSGGVRPYPSYDFIFGDGNATYTTKPYATHSYPTAGVYNATVLLFDAAGNSSLAVPVVVVVGGGKLLDVTLTANTTSTPLGGNVTFQVQASGGTAPYQYWIWFGDGTSTVPGPGAIATHTYRTAGGFCAWAAATDAAIPEDGGGSIAVSLAVGGVPRPICGSGPPPIAHLSSAVVAADLPGDLPLRFSASGGAGPLTAWIDAQDPYATACQCGIFRTAGTHEITVYANDSLGASSTASLNVTLYPALQANFTASALSGPAPLRVTFSATASGGRNASAALTTWQFGNGTGSGRGASASYLYTVPGEYLATASLMDQGEGNASSAFLIDVTAPGAAGLGIAGTISSAVRSLVGAPVAFRAVAVGASGGPVQFRWNLSDGSSGFGANLTESPIPTGCAPGANCSLSFTLTATGPGGALKTVAGALPDFFGAAYSALDLKVAVGPENATTPYRWSSSVNASGMPGPSVSWSFGDGSGASGPDVQHVYLAPGNYTIGMTVGDAAGDAWSWSQSVQINGSRIQPLAIVVVPGTFTCYAPCLENFSAELSGGAFPPFRVSWSFGPGATGNGTTVAHRFATPGSVTVWANATDGLGEVAVDMVAGTVLAPTALNLTLTVSPASVGPGGVFHLQARSVPICPVGSNAGCPGAEPPLLLEVRTGTPTGIGPSSTLFIKAVPRAVPGAGVFLSFPAPPLVGPFWFVLVPASPAYIGLAIADASVTPSAAAGSVGAAAASAALGLILLGAVGGAAVGMGAILLARRDDPDGAARRPPGRFNP